MSTLAAIGLTLLATAPFRLPPLLEGTLDNGLKVVVCARPGSGLVDVRLAVRAGSWLEGAREGSGVSHYFEHLLAAGSTAGRTSEQSRALVRSIGGALNARTDADRTWVYLTAAPAGFATAVDLLADWVQHAALAEAEVERERGVIQRELDAYSAQAPRRAWELLHATAFTEHPARLPLQGYSDRFRALRREDLQAYYAERFVPGNAVVSVVGDVDPGVAFNAVRAAFEGWPRRRLPATEVPVEPPQRGRRTAFEPLAGLRTASVALGYRGVDLDHDDAVALDLLAAVAGSGQGSRLWQLLVERERLCGAVTVNSRTPALGGGLFIVSADVAPDAVERFERSVQAALLALAVEPPSAGEVERARRHLRVDALFALESVEELAQALTRSWLQSGDCRFPERYLERLDRVTAEDLARVAERYLAPEQLTVAVVGPPRAAATAAAPAGAAAAPTDFALANGVRVRWLRNGGAAVAGLKLAFDAGSSRESEADGTSGAAAIVAELLSDGGRGAVRALRDRLEERGAEVVAAAERTAVGVGVRFLPADLELALEFAAAAARRAPFDGAALEAARTRAIALRDQRSRNGWLAGEARIQELAFSGCAFGQPLAGATGALERIDGAALERFAERTLVPGSLAIGLACDAEPAELALLLERTLGQLPPAPVPPPAGALVARFARPSFAVFDDCELPQATLYLAWAGADAGDLERRSAFDAIDAFATGRRAPSGPVFDALRVERDLAYAVDGTHWAWPGAGLFTLQAQCAPERYGEVAERLKGVLARLAAEGIAEADLAAARNLVLSARDAALQTALSKADLLARSLLAGQPADFDARYRAALAALTRERVNQILATAFAAEPLTYVLWPKGVARP